MMPRALKCRTFVTPILSCSLLTGACLLVPFQAGAQGSAQRVVQGKVIGTNDQPQSDAIVYLKNDKTSEIKSFISIKDGTFRFGQLSSDVDYDLWAEYQGKKSSNKTVSSFDSRKTFTYELKLK